MGEPLQHVKLNAQHDFRMQVVEALLAMGQDAPGSRKRRISGISEDGFSTLIHRHKHIKISTSSNCAYYKGGRFHNQRRKRVALAEVAANQGRLSKRTTTTWGCK